MQTKITSTFCRCLQEDGTPAFPGNETLLDEDDEVTSSPVGDDRLEDLERFKSKIKKHINWRTQSAQVGKSNTIHCDIIFATSLLSQVERTNTECCPCAPNFVHKTKKNQFQFSG